MSRSFVRTVFISILALSALVSARARAADELPVVHPLFAHLPDEPEDDTLRRAFTAAAVRYHLRPVEVVDVAAPPPPRAPDEARIGILNAQKLAFGAALHDLDAAAADVAATGGDGLSTAELSDLYLYRAMATARADWNAAASAAPTPERTRAFDDYRRAATLAPDRTLNPRELPPQVVADFKRADGDVKQRPRGALVVKGSADAQVAVDGGAMAVVAGGVTINDLAYGDHLIHVEELGRAPWGAVVSLAQPSLDVDIPPRAELALDAATAAAHARRMGAQFALVAQPKGGPGSPLALRLIDAAGSERDAAVVSATGEAGLIDAAVMRLDEEARRLVLEAASQPVPVTTPTTGPATATAAPAAALAPPLLTAAPPQRATLSDDPAAWARDHWPLLAAVGVVALSAIVLGAAVSSDR